MILWSITRVIEYDINYYLLTYSYESYQISFVFAFSFFYFMSCDNKKIFYIKNCSDILQQLTVIKKRS